MTTLTRKQLADQSGVGLETLRYYEREGLILEPPRTESGYRQYPLETAKRIRFIKRAQGLGFTLPEVKELLSLRVTPGTTPMWYFSAIRSLVALASWPSSRSTWRPCSTARPRAP